MMKQGEPFRAKAYQKASETIIGCLHDIVSVSQLKGLPGIGTTILEKLTEYVETGTLKVLERERSNPVNVFTDIYGVGPKKAKELVAAGILSISQLRENPAVLNDVQRVGLQYYEDVLQRIPREEIVAYESVFRKVVPAQARFEIVGSYRRGALTSGDIDVIVTSTSAMDFVQWVDRLLTERVILHVLSRGPSKCLVMARIAGAPCVRRVDFLYSTPEEYPFSVLYFTGSKYFNTVMRHRALEMGYTMNEHGLYAVSDGKKGEKVSHVFSTEADIFAFLGLVYKHPNERIDGRAVQRLGAAVTKKEPSVAANSHLMAFQKKGLVWLQGLTQAELVAMLSLANEAYRHGATPLLTDSEYDILEDYIHKRFPQNPIKGTVGAPVERNKVTLPYEMASMDKIKPDTGALASWKAKYPGPYVLSCKLDGVSGLYSTEGTQPALYTRGDGLVGQDVSHLIPYLKLPTAQGIVIRGELILPKQTFVDKYKGSFANPRNLVSGIVNRASVDDKITDVHFVAYEVIQPVLRPSQQLSLLAQLNIHVVQYQVCDNLTNALLSDWLVHGRTSYAYEMDGVIVTQDSIFPRKSGNPEHAFAFKMVLSDQTAEAKVVDVLWSPSKDGYLKPRVQIEPIHLGGVVIEFATGFNAAFIQDQRIGVGAIVKLIRSGDVIPYIQSVTVPASLAKMPEVPFVWNDTHVDVMLEHPEENRTVREKNITLFFHGLGVEGLSSGNVARLVACGFDTVPVILKMSESDFLQVPGFKDKLASKMYKGIREKIAAASLLEIMAVSNVWGRGFSETKLQLILQNYPDVLTDSSLDSETKIKRLVAIKGMADKTARVFVEHIGDFLAFLKQCGLLDKLAAAAPPRVSSSSSPLYNKKIVLTGFRNDALTNQLKQWGASVSSYVSKQTFVLLIKDPAALDLGSGKLTEAKELNVPIMTVDVFAKTYGLSLDSSSRVGC